VFGLQAISEATELIEVPEPAGSLFPGIYNLCARRFVFMALWEMGIARPLKEALSEEETAAWVEKFDFSISCSCRSLSL
jgi:hypothetical protein